MTLVTSAVLSNDEARGELVRLQLQFLEEPIVPIEQADVAWLVEDDNGHYPQVNFLGPIVLVGKSAQAASSCAPGPVVAQTPWPLLYRVAQGCLAVAYRATRGSRDATAGLPRVDLFVGSSDSALEVQRSLSKLSPVDNSVLIQTLPGGASEAIARAIHENSPRAQHQYVPINCGLIPADLLDSELFGHEQGAFPGALVAKTGRIELAGSGTLFIENVDKLPPHLQSKLMRFLQEGSFERLGSMSGTLSEVRVIASSTQALPELVAQNQFRNDLMQHFEAGTIVVPALNARSQDVPELLNAVAMQVRASQGLDVRFTVDAMEHLSSYSWPGDVTELTNLVARMSIEYPNAVISSEELPRKFKSASNVVDIDASPAGDSRGQGQSAQAPLDLLPLNGIDLKSHIANLEQSLIEQALQDSNAVVARAADRLHIRRTTLVEKMRKYGISRAS